MNAEFIKFIDLEGSQVKAGEYLGISETMVSRIKTNERKLTAELADKIIEKYPNLNFRALVLPERVAA